MDTNESSAATGESVRDEPKRTPDPPSSNAFSLELLSRDLIQCKRERDEYKAVADRLRSRCHALASKLDSCCHAKSVDASIIHSLTPCVDRLGEDRSTPLGPVLLELAQQNKYLLWEVEELKARLIEAEADLDLLRSHIPAGPHSLDQVESQLLYFRSHVRLMEQELQAILAEKEHERLMHKRQMSELKRQNEILEEMLRRAEERLIESSE